MPNPPCENECKYQKHGTCILEQANWARPNDGAECMSHLFEKEKEAYLG